MIQPRRCLVDTNVILRAVQSRAEFPSQHRALERLATAGTRLFLTTQNIAEFWNVSTRPRDKGGRGLSPASTREQVADLHSQFELITETRDTFDIWLNLVTTHQVSGRQIHDARLVAHMHARNIPALLTSNTKDFTRYPGLQLLDPAHLH